MPTTTRDSSIQLIINILRDAGEPISNQRFDDEVRRILGDNYKQSQHIRISNLRTALRSVGVVSHPRRGLWGLMPGAEERIADLEGVNIWAEHIRLRDAKRSEEAAEPQDSASMLELTRKLVETWGPPGYEHRIRDIIRDEVADLADDISVDGLGNLICRVGSGGPKVLMAAHMDEIGLMANYQEPESGYLRFTNLGGLMTNTLNGNRVQFEDGTVGVIAVQNGGGKALGDFFIDVQEGSGGNATPVGQPAGFMREMQVRGGRIIAKSLDDRIGCVVAIETMRRLGRQTPNELYFAFTVQEEVGLRGAKTAAQGVKPDIGIAIDVTGSGDQIRGRKMLVKLGGGAAIKVHDPGLIVPLAIKNWMIERCEADGIPYQLELLAGGTTDASAIQMADAGVPSGCISIPTRYLHTTSETVDIGDVEACIDLLTGLLANDIKI